MLPKKLVALNSTVVLACTKHHTRVRAWHPKHRFLQILVSADCFSSEWHSTAYSVLKGILRVCPWTTWSFCPPFLNYLNSANQSRAAVTASRSWGRLSRVVRANDIGMFDEVMFPSASPNRDMTCSNQSIRIMTRASILSWLGHQFWTSVDVSTQQVTSAVGFAPSAGVLAKSNGLSYEIDLLHVIM